jgi:hypothetical protein
MPDDDNPRNADFIAHVISDPKNPQETRMLTGWLGDAAEEGYRRLYTNAELSAYIDIPVDAILHTEPIRDVQPPGGVFVWVRRDAELKQGGSAFSRASRFLQGQVQRDFASAGGAGEEPVSPEKAGYRCVTQVPCGEPTGFTGRCTKQPVVGDAWPCITANPHCSEPTGLTGQCTHQPWPNPTRYIGCTFLHCPTQDLTHIPQICNIVATGMLGCPGVDPQAGGGDPAAKAAVAEEGKEGGADAAVHPTPPFTVLPGCGYTRTWGLCPTLPPKCTVSVDIPCITQDNACGPTRNPAHCLTDVNAFAGGGGIHPTIWTQIGPQCGGGAAFRAAVPDPVPVNSQIAQCTQTVQCKSMVDACPTRIGCDTQAPTAFCTQIPEACPAPTLTEQDCPTFCGAHCQTQQEACTQLNCTHVAACPSIGIVCTTFPAGCPVTTLEHNCAAQPQAFRAAAPIGPTAFLGCTQMGAQCPTYPSGDCTFFGCPTNAQARAGGPAIGCTQSGAQCPTYPNGDCTFFGGCPPTPATVCTQVGAQCPTHAKHCTFAGPACPPTPATVCTQFEANCPSAVDACPTRLCGGGQQFIGAARGGVGPIGPTGFLGCTQFQPQCPQGAGWSNGPHCTRYINCLVLITQWICEHIMR